MHAGFRAAGPLVAVDLATGATTTLPFRESGPAGSGTVAW
jgi:hypothetical protein